jgi:hypothetical protein
MSLLRPFLLPYYGDDTYVVWHPLREPNTLNNITLAKQTRIHFAFSRSHAHPPKTGSLHRHDYMALFRYAYPEVLRFINGCQISFSIVIAEWFVCERL